MSDKDSMFKLDFQRNPQANNISDLWKHLANFATNRVNDNPKYEFYPLTTRIRQLGSLKALVAEVERTHERMETLWVMSADANRPDITGETVASVVTCVGDFKHLWSWLCGGFWSNKEEGYDTRPLLYRTASAEPSMVSVDVFHVGQPELDKENSIQYLLWTELGEKFQKDPNHIAEYDYLCRRVMLLTEEETKAQSEFILKFPRDPSEDDSFDVIVNCNFETGVCVFNRA